MFLSGLYFSSSSVHTRAVIFIDHSILIRMEQLCFLKDDQCEYDSIFPSNKTGLAHGIHTPHSAFEIFGTLLERQQVARDKQNKQTKMMMMTFE